MYPDPKDQLQPFLTQSAHSYTLILEVVPVGMTRCLHWPVC